jgi:hypothetical protein
VLITTEQLKEATGYTQLADVEKCLKRNGIPFIQGKPGHVFTTEAAINAAMGVSLEDPVRTSPFEIPSMMPKDIKVF